MPSIEYETFEVITWDITMIEANRWFKEHENVKIINAATEKYNENFTLNEDNSISYTYNERFVIYYLDYSK